MVQAVFTGLEKLSIGLACLQDPKIPSRLEKTVGSDIFHFKSRLSLIVRVNVVLNRTVVVDSD